MPHHRLSATFARAALALLAPLVPLAAQAQQAVTVPPCSIGFPVAGTTAAQAQGEVRARAHVLGDTTTHEGLLQLMLAPDADGPAAQTHAQRAIVQISHVRRDPDGATPQRNPQVGWQKVAVRLEKTRGTGDKASPYRLRLGSKYEGYGLQPLSAGGDRAAGEATFLTDNYGAPGAGVPQMDLGRQLSRNSQDLLLTLEDAQGTPLARWTIPAADLKAASARMDTGYTKLDEAIAAGACKAVPALSGY